MPRINFELENARLLDLPFGNDKSSSLLTRF